MSQTYFGDIEDDLKAKLSHHRRHPSLFQASFDKQNSDLIIPKVLSQSSYYEDQIADNLLDENQDTRWNAGHISGWDVPNWVTFDFGQSVRVTKFALQNAGDYNHDVCEFDLQTSELKYGPWRTVASLTAEPSLTSWQLFTVSGVSRYWRLNITSRYSRYQAYLTGVRFQTSLELGRFENLSNVEKEFLRNSKRADVYPNEQIGVIEVQNVAELGQLTALAFIEWIIDNPNGVIGLPTGKTPELFIKWLRYYKTNWNKPAIQKELKQFGIDVNKNKHKNYDSGVPSAEATPTSPDNVGGVSTAKVSLESIKTSGGNGIVDGLLGVGSGSGSGNKKDNGGAGGGGDDDSIMDDEKYDGFPDTSNLHFVQLDEFFPIHYSEHNSFLNYIRKYYQSTLELKDENMQIFDFSTMEIFKEHDMHKVFPTGKVDLTLKTRQPRNNLENLQKQAIMEAEKLCADYEKELRDLGGYGFFLGGIGHDGHIAFNFRGCDPKLGTRLVQLNYETAAQTAGDFGGINNTRNKTAVTVGLSSIIFNKNAKIIIMAAGEKKATMVRDAIMLPSNRLRPASVFHTIPGARFYLTQGASVYLADRRTQDIKRLCESNTLSQSKLYQCVCDLAIRKKKRVLHLTTIDFLSQPQTHAVYCWYTSNYNKSIMTLTREVEAYLIEMLERGISLPAGKRILHTSPHHDDIMLAYHEITPFLFKYNENYFSYVTSGFNSVSDEYIVNILKQINVSNKDVINKYLKQCLNYSLEDILNKFKYGYENKHQRLIDDSEIYLVLRRVKQVWNIDTVEKFITTIDYLLNDYFRNKIIGGKDISQIRKLKGLIRESECDRMWYLQNINPKTNIFHLRSKFYTGEFFNPLPTISEDCKPMLGLYETLKPSLITVAFDPEGTGPDTHYKVLQVVAQALRLSNDKKLGLNNCKIWGYRNVWHRFEFATANLAIPITAKTMNEMHSVFLASFGCQKQAQFPSPEYDGPFSVLSQRFHTMQLKELKCLLGNDYFDSHWNEQIRMADGIILLKEMNVAEFLKHAQDLRSKIEIHKTIESEEKEDDDAAVNTQSNIKENNLDGHDANDDTKTDL